MKKLLFIALLLPLGLMAQKNKDYQINFDSTKYPAIYKSIDFKNNVYYSVDERTTIKMSLIQFIVKEKTGKELMRVDTAGVIHVYGDTLSVLKAIIRGYSIKVKD